MSLRMQAAHSAIPAHLLHTLPYLASLAVFAIACVRLRDSGAPAALDRREKLGERPAIAGPCRRNQVCGHRETADSVWATPYCSTALR